MLIKTIEEIRQVLGTLQKGLSADALIPYVEQAELRYLLPVLGQEQYTDLDTAYNAGSMTTAQTALHQHISRAVAYYSLLEALPFLNVAIGNAGVMENTPNNATPARQWSFDKLELATSRNADTFLDAALAFLEYKITDYPVWAASSACTLNRELFINNATTLSRYLNIQGSRRAYLAFRPFLIRAEELYILQFIGQDQYDLLKTHIAQPELLTVQEKILWDKIRPVVAQMALAEALPELAINLSGAGMSVLNDAYQVRQRLSASQEEVSGLGNKARLLGERYLTEMRQFLDKNADLYPLYMDSDLYQEPDAGTSYELPENTAGSGSFLV